MSLKRILCRLGFHHWSANHGGIRICLWCPAVDRYYGISGYLRRQFELTSTNWRGSNAELREGWTKNEQQRIDLKYMIIAGEVASSSTCAKKQLGCVLVLKNTNNIITGVNGPPAGLKKCEGGNSGKASCGLRVIMLELREPYQRKRLRCIFRIRRVRG